jgi:hypothetical protein
MATITFRSSVTVQLLHFGASKPLPPDPRARESFRLTTRSPDPQTRGRKDANGTVLKHNGVDVGKDQQPW